MNEYLAKLISKKNLLWCKESYSCTNLKSLALYELVQIKFPFQLVLCLFKKFEPLLRLKSLDEASKETDWLKFFIQAEVLN